MAGQQQSPLQERDRRFESGSLQQRVRCERNASPDRDHSACCGAEPEVRIHLPPAVSPQTLGPSAMEQGSMPGMKMDQGDHAAMSGTSHGLADSAEKDFAQDVLTPPG